MLPKSTATNYRPALDKIRQKTLVFGARTLLTELRLEEGVLLPPKNLPAGPCKWLAVGLNYG